MVQDRDIEREYEFAMDRFTKVLEKFFLKYGIEVLEELDERNDTELSEK